MSDNPPPPPSPLPAAAGGPPPAVLPRVRGGGEEAGRPRGHHAHIQGGGGWLQTVPLQGMRRHGQSGEGK